MAAATYVRIEVSLAADADLVVRPNPAEQRVHIRIGSVGSGLKLFLSAEDLDRFSSLVDYARRALATGDAATAAIRGSGAGAEAGQLITTRMEIEP
jgi:hypothetical protein